MNHAIILCSGGLDSVVTAHYVKKSLKYPNLIVLFFNYNQRSLDAERKSAKFCASSLNAEFLEIRLSELAKLSGSLINKKEKHSELKLSDLKDTSAESKNWYVPCRNLLFLSYASALADSLFINKGLISDIFTGFKCEGKDPFPDATEEFVQKFNLLTETSCSRPIKVFAPLIKKDKEDIVLLGKQLSVPLQKTFSCYTGSKKHCGSCLACRLRQEGFYWANENDLTVYAKAPIRHAR